jgi:hypothetical protein
MPIVLIQERDQSAALAVSSISYGLIATLPLVNARVALGFSYAAVN